ncbi:MAG: T9SS type A sorting domain-containing protein, partial [Dysgonamonadaceae bacterium]|nr:T9SS type A sorting domain-containing protein [Dysgonamonadaceae bacterium]
FTTPSEGQQSAGLRSSSVPEDKLDIIASNGQGSVRTTIAKREYGTMTFGNNDTRKIVMGINPMPEIYSIKESLSGGLIAAGSSVINTDNALIPLGLLTSWAGEIRFTFKGMDYYNAQIKFIDLVAGQEIDITGESEYEYSFEYTPAVDSEKHPVADESRFFIRFTPAVSTGLSDSLSGTTKVYSNEDGISVVSSEKIYQVSVYDLRGALVSSVSQVKSTYLRINKPLPRSEVYIVKVSTESGVKNVKIMIGD